MLLEAADYDPLRAQQIENELTQEWWERWLVDREERVKAINHRSKKNHG